MAKMSGGEALAKSLVREGVEVVFAFRAYTCLEASSQCGTIRASELSPRAMSRGRRIWRTAMPAHQENRG